MNDALVRLIIPGTPADVVRHYQTLAERARALMLGTAEEEFVVLDTETTGFTPGRDSLIEIAAAVMSGSQIVSRFSTFVNPGAPIPELISDLTGITDQDVQDAPSAPEAVEQLIEFVGDRRIIAHNASFDQGFIQAFAPTASIFADASIPLLASDPWIDTVELARIALPRLRAHNLEGLSAAFAPEQQSTHRAIDDVEALCLIWRVLLVALGDLPDGLPGMIGGLHEGTPWALRDIIILAGEHLQQGAPPFSLTSARAARLAEILPNPKIDALELDGGIAGLQQVTRSELEHAYSATGLVGAMYTNYEPRAEQVEMATAIAEAYGEGKHRAIEAGTGVGKSMAYLLPQVLFAQRNQITCGVATKTNALLDQLIYHELPRLSAALAADATGNAAGTVAGNAAGNAAGTATGADSPLSPQAAAQAKDAAPSPLRYVALKGYDHYPCLRKLMALATGERDKHRACASAAALATIAQLLAFAVQSAHDDLDPLPLHWGELPRFEVCASADDCLHYHCRYYRSCLLHSARRQAEQADIVVTNHALLFCDVMAERGILPPIRHWVIDEAHGVESEARRQLSVGIEARGLHSLLDSLLYQGGILHQIKRRAAALEGGLLVIGLADKALADSQAIQAVSTSFFAYLKDLTRSDLVEQSSYDRIDLWISEQVRDSGAWGMLASSGRALAERLQVLLKACRDINGAAAEHEELLELRSDLAGLIAQINAALEALTLIMDGTDEEYVYSAELDRRENVASDRLVAARIDIGSVLLDALYPEEMSVVFTSATIATSGAGAVTNPTSAAASSDSPFAYFEQGVGLNRLPASQCSTLQLASSYDFEHNMTVILPRDMPEPNTRNYSASLEELLYSLHCAMGGSTLTLFTNRREMEQHYASLKDRLAAEGITLRCQFRGTSTKRLRDDFLADKSLSLFALRSFWEGFDAPGDTLRCVVIPKLPFGRPNDPLQKERERHEGWAAWRHYVLPEAIIDLKQAAGRLIRSSTDSGYLVLADARLRTKSYGSAFLAALPSQNQHAMDIKEIAQLVRTNSTEVL